LCKKTYLYTSKNNQEHEFEDGASASTTMDAVVAKLDALDAKLDVMAKRRGIYHFLSLSLLILSNLHKAIHRATCLLK
jgi:hypothetical protein